jgi:hypothetical protein
MKRREGARIVFRTHLQGNTGPILAELLAVILLCGHGQDWERGGGV